MGSWSTHSLSGKVMWGREYLRNRKFTRNWRGLENGIRNLYPALCLTPFSFTAGVIQPPESQRSNCCCILRESSIALGGLDAEMNAPVDGQLGAGQTTRATIHCNSSYLSTGDPQSTTAFAKSHHSPTSEKNSTFSLPLFIGQEVIVCNCHSPHTLHSCVYAVSQVQLLVSHSTTP